MLMVKIRQMAPLYEVKLLNLLRTDIQYAVGLMSAKNRVNNFGSFLDIRQNAEWHLVRFMVHPACLRWISSESRFFYRN